MALVTQKFKLGKEYRDYDISDTVVEIVQLEARNHKAIDEWLTENEVKHKLTDKTLTLWINTPWTDTLGHEYVPRKGQHIVLFHLGEDIHLNVLNRDPIQLLNLIPIKDSK